MAREKTTKTRTFVQNLLHQASLAYVLAAWVSAPSLLPSLSRPSAWFSSIWANRNTRYLALKVSCSSGISLRRSAFLPRRICLPLKTNALRRKPHGIYLEYYCVGAVDGGTGCTQDYSSSTPWKARRGRY